MFEPGKILNRLFEKLEASAKERRIADFRIGLSYVCVKLDSGHAGLSAVLPETNSGGCTVLKEAGTYVGASASESLKYLTEGKNSLHRAIGLATANALIAPPEDETENQEATSYLKLRAGEKVAMVGLFAPLVERIRSTGAVLTVIEKNPARLNPLSPQEKSEALKNCEVAIITATTLLNNTFEETVQLLGQARAVALIGPSTPLAPDVFSNTPVTHLGGAVVADASRALQIVSEGGGTPALRPYLRFVNLFL